MKPALATLAILALTGFSYYGSTQLGLRTEGSLDIQVEAPKLPRYDSVGRNLYSHDGTKLLMTAIERRKGPNGTKHVIHASVKGTHRYALQLFPARMVHTFSIDRKAAERTILEAAGVPQGRFIPTSRRWELVQ